MGITNKTPEQKLHAYFPEGGIYDSLYSGEGVRSDYATYLKTYVEQFSTIEDIFEDLLKNLLPFRTANQNYVGVWESIIGLDTRSRKFPKHLSLTPNSVVTRWNWVRYAVFEFNNIRTIADINTALTALALPVTAYMYNDASSGLKSAFDTLHPDVSDNYEACVIFDIGYYTSGTVIDFPYDFPADLRKNIEYLDVVDFLEHLVPVTCRVGCVYV